MPNARLAEWTLALVTTEDRAAATVGDLLEQNRDAVFFWLSVLSTALSLAWQDVTEHPRQTASLAARGTLYTFTCLLAGVIASFMLLFVLDVHDFATWPFKIVGFLFGYVWIPFKLGRWIARKAPGHELAICLATVILQTALGMTISATVAVINHRASLDAASLDIGLSLLGTLPFFAFTILATPRGAGRQAC